MAKIIGIQESTVIIEERSKSRALPLSVFNFTPAIGDEVKIFSSGANFAVLKLDPAQSSNKFVDFLRKLFPKKSKPVRKIVYCLLAFSFGNIGIHKFYAGQTGLGVAYILLNWTGIPSLLSFIDLVQALFRRADADNCITVW